MKKNKLRFILTLLFVIVSLNFIKLAGAEQVYYPYPIVFVHGINSSDGMWIGMRDELRQYFREGLEYKYPTHFTELNYFIGCDYKDQNNGVIADIAKIRLRQAINDALSLYPSSIPESERKVIIVCHSMGGLVTRSLLKQIPSYKDKIHRVVFIDTPHLGSPYASALWLFNELTKDARAGYESTMYQSYSAFSPFALMYAGFIDYPDLYFKVGNTQRHINELLFILERTGPRPSGEAIRDLRVPAFTYYEKVYQGFVSSIRIYKDYLGSDTFLGQNNLDVPPDYKVIVGKNTSGLATTLWKVDKVFNLSEPFTFPTLAGEAQTLDNAIFNGDGIVTMSSQKLNKIDYQVNAFHVGAADAAIDKTLQAIDDAPVIESVRAVPVDWNNTFANSWYYLVFKLKDYLLADIEVEKLDLITDTGTIDLLASIPAEYKESSSYKPYLQFKKYFLQERTYDDDEKGKIKYKDIEGKEKYLHLMPGEFFIKTVIPLNAQSLYIKVKNPADQYDATHTKFTTEKTLTIARPKITTVDFTPHNRRLTSIYWSPHNIHAIDVPPYDQSYTYEDENHNIRPCPDSLPDTVNLSFKIEESPTQQVKVNAWLYSAFLFPHYLYYKEGVYKRFSAALPVTLESADSFYNKYFDPNIEPFAIWNGNKDEGGYVPPWPGEFPLGSNPPRYKIKITVEPDDDPFDDKLYLLGSNWDDPNHNKEENPNNAIIVADPTFIQASRRMGVSW